MLKDYVEKHNKIPTQRTKHKDVNIGWWCHTQRTNFKKGTLSPKRIDALEKGIEGWYWSETITSIKLTWEEWYDVLKDYVEKHNKIPTNRTKHKDVNIGWWCRTQRTKHKKGTLSPKRIDALEKGIKGWYWEKIA